MNNPFDVRLPAIDRPDSRGLWANIATAVLAVLLINGLIFSLGWGSSPSTVVVDSSYEVPGEIVGSVWVFLFVDMAVARWLLNEPVRAEVQEARWWVSALIINCVFYPFYTLALNSAHAGLAGNLLISSIATYAVVRVWAFSKVAAGLCGVVVVWVLFASYTLVGSLGWLE